MTDLDPDSGNQATDDDGLSPSVKRLVRQYDIDITGIHGSGPDGRLRPSDIMALIGGGRAPDGGDIELVEARVEPLTERSATRNDRQAERSAKPEPASPPISVVFECDLSRVLAHQKRLQESAVAPSLTSYVVVALRGALAGAPAMARAETARLRLVLDAPDGRPIAALLEPTAATQAAIDAAIVAAGADRAAQIAAPASDAADSDGAHASTASTDASDSAAADAGTAALTVRHHGLGGSLLAVPLPVAAGELATLGIGALRRVLGVKRINGTDTPRVVAQCYLSLSFRVESLRLEQANRLLGECVRLLEDWPLEPATV